MTLKRNIEMALEGIGVLAEGAEASPGQIDGALDYLNALLGAWSTERLMIPYVSKTTAELPVARTLRVGPGLDISTEAVPVDITAIAIYKDGNTYRPYPVPEDSIFTGDTTLDTIPGRYALSFGDDAVTIIFSATPPPNCSIELQALFPFNELVDLTAELTFPSGYDQLLHSSLSVVLAPKYGKTVRQDIASMAADAYLKIKYKHASERMVPILTIPDGYPRSSDFQYSINQGSV